MSGQKHIFSDKNKKLSEAAFKEIFNQYHKKLYFYFIRQTKSEFLAEELVQLTFIKFWKNFSHIPKDISISSQLFQIARSALIDEYRKAAREKEVLKNIKSEKQRDVVNNTVFETCLNEDINKAINSLPPARKKIFKHRRLEGLSLKEIATLYSISTKTVEDHITKATKHLRTVLRESHIIGLLLFFWF